MGRMWVVAACALAVAGAAEAQRVSAAGPGASYPPPRPQVYYPPLPPAPVQPVAGQRWGGDIDGRWWGGAHAPGGWAAYRPARRGFRLPSYWAAPGFRVHDWNAFGLPQPPVGYAWSRYYDDAVLIDARGDVRDAVRGVDWDLLDRDYDRLHRGRRDEVAGESGDDARLGPPPQPYRAWAAHRRHAHGPERVGSPPPATWTSPDGRTTVTVTSGGPAIIAQTPGYGHDGATTITVQSAPVVTTVTEIVEDRVTYSRPPVRARRSRPR